MCDRNILSLVNDYKHKSFNEETKDLKRQAFFDLLNEIGVENIFLDQHFKIEGEEIYYDVSWYAEGSKKIKLLKIKNKQNDYINKIEENIINMQNNFENKSILLQNYIKLSKNLRRLEKYANEENNINLSRIAMIMKDALERFDFNELKETHINIFKKIVDIIKNKKIDKQTLFEIDEMLENNSMNWLPDLGE